MQEATIIKLLAGALVITLVIWPLIATRLAATARANGFDDGHTIARNAAQQRIDLLNVDLATLAEKRAAERYAHVHERDRIAQELRDQYGAERDRLIEDADRRIATYARRANPFTEQDLATLADTNKCLTLACNTYAGLQAWDAHTAAATQQTAIRAMHERLKQALAEQGTPPVEASPPALVKSYLVHGPMACGKTRNARAIADTLGLTEVLDDWQPGMPVPAFNTLVLTNSDGPFPPFKRRILSFDEAMQRVEAQRMEVAA